MSNQKLEEAHYEPTSDEYLAQRQLPLSTVSKGSYLPLFFKEFAKKRALPHPNWLFLWALAVGGVISGHFVGWNSGLAVAGFWGMVIANLVIALMYAGLVFSVAELVTALPHAGGFYSYVRYAFGPFAAFVCGLTVTIQYVFLAAVSVGLIAKLLSTTFGLPAFLWALLLYAIFVAINIRGLDALFLIARVVTPLAIAILFLFSQITLFSASFQSHLLFYVLPDANQSAMWLPKGWLGLFAALPFAMWFYLPIEQIAFAAEEIKNPNQKIPEALKRGFATLFALSFLALLFISGSGGGAAVVANSLVPVADTLTAIFGGGSLFFTLLTMVALFASPLAFLYASGRIIFALSRAGYFPRQLSLTGRYQSPTSALSLAAVVGVVCFYLIDLIGDAQALLSASAILCALLSYLFVMASYIQLKREHPHLPRPYESPLSSRGASVSFMVALITLLACLTQPAFRSGFYGVGFILLISAQYYVFFSSQQLVAEAPEEKQALLIKPKAMGIGRLIATRIAVVLVVLITLRFTITLGIAAFRSACPPACMGATLIRENFSSEDLSKSNFIEANLQQANLERADLSGSDLSGANLAHASLANANLSGAKLIGTNLFGADLGGAMVSHTDMRGANLNEANLTKVDLTSARLDGVKLEKAQLVGANLSGVNIAGVKLTKAYMKRINLSNANLAGSLLSGADLSGAFLNGSNIAGSWLNNSNLTGARLNGADLSGASLIGANLTSVDLSNAKLVGSTIIGASFLGAKMVGANLKEARFQESQLNKRVLLRDPVLLQLNELQLTQIIKDANLSGVESDEQTVWPSTEFLALLALDVEEELREQELAEDAILEDAIKVGLLYSLTGPLALSEQSMRNGTLLAIDELNAAGGVLGRPLHPIVEDGASNEVIFVQKARKLLEEDEVDVIFGGSRYRELLTPVLTELKKSLLFSATSSQGFESDSMVFYIGSEPAQQIIPAIAYLLNEGHQKFFLLSTNDLYGDRSNLIVKAMLNDAGAKVVGEAAAALEEGDFSGIISQIETTEPTTIFNTLGGSSNVAFFRQLREAGILAERIAVMSMSVSEQEIRAIGVDNIFGHFSSSSYFQTIPLIKNNIFVSDYKELYGQESVTSAPIHASYTAVYLWNELVKKAGATDFQAIIEAAASNQIEYEAPSGLIRLDGESHHTYLPARIGIIRKDALIEEVAGIEEPIKPDPFLSQYEWAKTLSEVIEGQ